MECITHTSSDGYGNVPMLVTGRPLGWANRPASDRLKSPWEENCKRCDNKVFHSVDVEETHGGEHLGGQEALTGLLPSQISNC